VGKKKRELLDAKREQFVRGCQENGYDDETAQRVYDLIVRFANYGFNRSHAAAYAVLAFRTAYLRAHHLPEFLATLLSLATGDEKKTAEYVRDARMHGIEVRPPSIQYSHIGYRVEEPGVIRIGLLSVRNVGRGAVEAILAARADGPFHSLVDFLRRINPRTCNRKVVEGLLAVGALADFLPQRLSPKAATQVLMEAYVQAQAGGLVGGLGLELASPLFFVRYTQAEGQSQVLRQIQQVLRTNPGSVRVALYEQNRRRLRLLPNRWSVNPSPELVSVLEEIVGMGNAKLGTMPAGENGPLATE
jgi:DNA polymerase-3 subunit alpha